MVACAWQELVCSESGIEVAVLYLHIVQYNGIICHYMLQ
jgi:hypothetical protein